ncbi:MAG: hypothetical protein P8010_25090 [Desulfosarcinaceae bacterium]
MDEKPEAAAGGSPHEEAGSEDPSRAPRAEGDSGCQNFDAHQYQEEPPGQIAGEDQVDAGIAHAEDVRELKGHHSQEEAAHCSLEVLGEAHALEEVFGGVEGVGEGDTGEATDQPEDHVEGELPNTDQFIGRYGEGREVAQVVARHRCSDNGRDDDGAEGGQAELGQGDFQGEHHAGNGSVEGGGDAGGSPTTHQGPHALGGNFEELPDRGADGRPDLDDGPLPAHAPAGADADRRCQRFYHHQTFTDQAVFQGDGIHHLRHPVAFGFGGVKIDQGPQDEAAQGRHQEDMKRREIRCQALL